MQYKVLEKIGRAGNFRTRQLTQERWTKQYGNSWFVGYLYNDKAYTYEEALKEFYNKSYYEFMKNNSEVVEELCNEAKELYNPHAEKTGGVDLQVPAVLEALKKLGKEIHGNKRIAIGTYGAKYGIIYHPLSTTLSPYKVPLWCNKDLSVENFWQSYKYLLKENK